MRDGELDLTLLFLAVVSFSMTPRKFLVPLLVSLAVSASWRHTWL